METFLNYKGLKSKRRYVFVTCLTLSVFVFSCSKDENPVVHTGKSKSYTLPSLYGGPVSGELVIKERTDKKVELEVKLTGTTSGLPPTHIHLNTWAEGGDVVIDFDESVVVIDKLANGTPVTYDALINFDGFIAVHESASNLNSYLILADIGQNALTGKSKSYNLSDLNSVQNGTIKFEERVNGETLVTIKLTNNFSMEAHPAHIHNGSLASPGSIAADLNTVSQVTGLSFTNIVKANNTSINYSGLLTFNGYAAVHASAADLNPISLGNVGSN